MELTSLPHLLLLRLDLLQIGTQGCNKSLGSLLVQILIHGAHGSQLAILDLTKPRNLLEMHQQKKSVTQFISLHLIDDAAVALRAVVS